MDSLKFRDFTGDEISIFRNNILSSNYKLLNFNHLLDHHVIEYIMKLYLNKAIEDKRGKGFELDYSVETESIKIKYLHFFHINVDTKPFSYWLK